jgi:hypothetical protein
VFNHISIKPRASNKDIAIQITAALKRQAERGAKHIDVEIVGSVRHPAG